MIRLAPDPFEPGALLTQFCVGRAETGAVASFTGLARAEHGAASALELEAYPGFTESRIAEMAQAARARFRLDDLMIVHRVGKVAPGEAVVFVATASAHRRAAFEACDCLMDDLKSRAPFWKKEHGPHGPRWIEPTARDRADTERWSAA
jgi:molybdopterin synthase catalytic subunit